MCGILGVVASSGALSTSHTLFQRMLSQLAHRGPDDCGIFREDQIALGHRRLAIIDPESGKQPMRDPDCRQVLVYNGEIYNYRSIARELDIPPESDSDTEVLFRAWQQWGPNSIQRLRGMFAFGLWDTREQALYLVRDRLGIKPLYYAHATNGEFLFSSEFTPLVFHPALSREIDPQAVETYFAYGYIPAPQTIYKSVRKLLPGHWLRFDHQSGQMLIQQYWDLEERKHDARTARPEDLEQELRERMSEAVRLRLRADVPLGAFLSGGVDSSSVVALMCQLSDGNPIHTSSIGFTDSRFDESHYAQQVADHLGCSHESALIGDDDARRFGEILECFGEPFADSSALPTYLVSELARKHVTVALSGDGGDELFGGYRSYRLHLNKNRARALLPSTFRRYLFGPLARHYPKLDWAPKMFRAKRTLQDLSLDALSSFGLGAMITMPEERHQLFSRSLKHDLQGYDALEVLREHVHSARTDDPLAVVQYLDTKMYLADDILTKVDRTSMAHALEVRVPLLDHKLVEWVWQLPSSVKLDGNRSKIILKRAMETHLEHKILWRKKMGFSVPLARWLRTVLREVVSELSDAPEIRDCGLFDGKTLKSRIREHLIGTRDHSALLWALLSFRTFLNLQNQERGDQQHHRERSTTNLVA